MGRFLGTLAIVGLGAVLYSQYRKLQREKNANIKKN